MDSSTQTQTQHPVGTAAQHPSKPAANALGCAALTAAAGAVDTVLDYIGGQVTADKVTALEDQAVAMLVAFVPAPLRSEVQGFLDAIAASTASTVSSAAMAGVAIAKARIAAIVAQLGC